MLHARHSIAFAGFGLLTSTFALAQGRPYVYREVAAGGTGTGNGLSFLPPLINNNGTVAFYATKAGVGNGILTGPSFEANAVFTDTGVGPYSSVSSSFALNDAGSLAVHATVRARAESSSTTTRPTTSSPDGGSSARRRWL